MTKISQVVHNVLVWCELRLQCLFTLTTGLPVLRVLSAEDTGDPLKTASVSERLINAKSAFAHL